MNLRTLRAAALALFASTVAASCGSDSDTPVVVPTLNAIAVSLPLTSITLGQTTTASAVGHDQSGGTISTGAVTWTSSSNAVAKVDTSGVVTAIAAGTTQITATAGTFSGSATLTVTAPPGIVINEVESSGGTPGDWAELYNPTASAVDLSNWIIRDDDNTHTYNIPAGTVIAAGGFFVAEEAGFGFGLGAPDSVRLYNPYNFKVDGYGWTAHAATTYGRCPDGTGAFVTTTSSTKGAKNDCSVAVRINEVESNGGTPGDWVELYNAGGTTVDLSGYVFKDNDDTHNYTIPAGTTLAAGAYLTLEEAQFVFGIGAPDAARLFTPAGKIQDSLSWTTHATTTYGRCPNGSGAFVTTTSSTKGAANDCSGSGGGVAATAWPGDSTFTIVDGTSVFGGNLSGLQYEAATGGNPDILWGARNGVGTLFRLIFNGTIWTPDPANNWGAGKALHYPDGTGDPDAEGVTFANGSAGGMYVSTERNNGNNGVSRNAVLRFDPSAAGTSLTATNEWNLTADLPVTGANLGIEGITFVPDSVLTNRAFFDEAANKTYAPADYANHNGGLFFVGVEANGVVYAYALDHVANTAKRIATIQTGYTAGVMELNYDRELNYLWAVCDDGCGGLHSTLEIDQAAGSPTKGKFVVTHVFNRPATMPNLNNEGFTVTPQALCSGGRKPVYWSDDSETGGHAIRRGTIACTRF